MNSNSLCFYKFQNEGLIPLAEKKNVQRRSTLNTICTTEESILLGAQDGSIAQYNFSSNGSTLRLIAEVR